jgi:DNA-binding response OmpR family regulator
MSQLVKKVLIIDDEVPLLKIITRFLQKIEVEGVTASNGTEGIRLFETDPSSFNCVIIDYNLPGLSSKQITHRLKELNPNLKIILCTGFAADEIASEFSPIHIDECLQKPFTFQDFQNVLRRI